MCEGIEGSKAELAAEVVRASGALRLRVLGTSMLPAIRPGDELLICHCEPQEARLGEIALFTRDRRLFAHRVVGRSGRSLITQGDTVPTPDPPVSAGELLGKVVGVVRAGRPIPVPPRLTPLARAAAWLARRSRTAGRLLARLCALPGGASL